MSTSPEEFENLRKLLKLKRHEQPPPGYFDRLPDRITRQLEQEVEAQNSGGWAWLGRLRQVLAQNPISAGIFAICGATMVLVANSHFLDNYIGNGGSATLSLAPGSIGTGELADNNRVHAGLALAAQPPAADAMVSSVTPVFMNAPDSVLNSLNLSAQPVGYTFGH